MDTPCPVSAGCSGAQNGELLESSRQLGAGSTVAHTGSAVVAGRCSGRRDSKAATSGQEESCYQGLGRLPGLLVHASGKHWRPKGTVSTSRSCLGISQRRELGATAGDSRSFGGSRPHSLTQPFSAPITAYQARAPSPGPKLTSAPELLAQAVFASVPLPAERQFQPSETSAAARQHDVTLGPPTIH